MPVLALSVLLSTLKIKISALVTPNECVDSAPESAFVKRAQKVWLCWYKSRVTGGGRGGRPGGQCLGAADSAGNKATGGHVKRASAVCTAAVGLR